MNEPEVAAGPGIRSTSYYERPTYALPGDRPHRWAFTGGDQRSAGHIVGDLLSNDRFMVLADFQAYLDVQERIEAAYADKEQWTRSTILNVARSGFFSSDRSMRDYLERIWYAPSNQA